MRVLIVGGGGQVGRALTSLTWPDGTVVSAPQRQSLDLTKPPTLMREISAEDTALVVNAAAYTAVDDAEAHAEEAYAVNAAGPSHLAAATQAAGIPLIHVSTDYVFSGDGAAEYVESDATAPINVYGRTKLAGEEAVRRANPSHVIVRSAWIVSPYRANFVKTVLRLARERSQLRIVADQHGSPTSAGDLAAAIAIIASRILSGATSSFGTYHFVNAGEATWFSLAKRVLATSAASGGPHAEVVPIPTSEYPTPARRPRNSRLSTGHYERTFGAVPRRWETAVDEIVETLVQRQEPSVGAGG